MNEDAAKLVPLDAVAEDAVALIKAFRMNGAVSFQDAPVDKARANYVLACSANGLAREDVAYVEDLSFPAEGGTVRLRLYRNVALQEQPLPVVVFIHGGGWVIGDLDTHDGLCRHLANRTGAVVMAVDYRRAPEHPFPTPLDDCHAALSYLAANAKALGADLSRVVIVGDSAGGNMATVLASHPAYHRDDVTIVGQVLFYPVTDLVSDSASYQRITEGFALTAASMYWFREKYVPPGMDLSDDRLSPLRSLRTGPQPPMFIVTAGLDPLADEGIAYAASAAKNGTPVIHHHLPRHAHGLFTAAGKIETARRLLGTAAAFVHAVISRETSP